MAEPGRLYFSVNDAKHFFPYLNHMIITCYFYGFMTVV